MKRVHSFAEASYGWIFLQAKNIGQDAAALFRDEINGG
jgi:hypothetical protein